MKPLRKGLYLLVSLAFLAGCGTNTPAAIAASSAQASSGVSDLYVVDCLLPGQVRVVGGRTYLTPRRPTRATAGDCRIRGGEYVAYDRANLKSALNVWLPAAEQGDADAQNSVGEIFERGLGGEPNYEAAAIWYGKAAEQGHSSALLNLGTLYEQGRGVEKDRLKALNYYRRSWGLSEDDLLYKSAVDRELESVRNELQEQITERDAQIRLLQKQLDALEQQTAGASEAEGELQQLRAWVSRLQSEQAEEKQQFARLREPSESATPDATFNTAAGIKYRERNFGRYYALIIGNQDYEILEDLASPISDATRMAEVLERKYGFTVQLVQDANDATVLRAINNLNSVIGEQDNLLIYYAGHGSRRAAGNFETGYWLPVNAHRPPDDTFWVPTEQITSHMGNFKAQRVLVVADSCYSGLLEDDPGTRMSPSDDLTFLTSVGFVDRRFSNKARLLISSGGDSPVLDNDGDGNSVFAAALLSVLEANDGLLTTPALFLKVKDLVSRSAALQDFEQEPELKGIAKAGHVSGDFYFIPDAG
jgi:hypothetical protein